MHTQTACLEIAHTVSQVSLPGVVGQRKPFPDVNYGASGSIKPSLSGDHFMARLVKNATGGTLSAGAQVRYDWSNGDGIIEAASTCAAGEISDGNVDPFVGSGGVAANYYFWCVEEGPTKGINSASTSITAGDTVRTAASGKVLENTGNNVSAATFGRALETNATADALFRIYRYPKGASVASSAVAACAGANTPTVGAEAANVINIAIQLIDQNGVDMARAVVCQYYVSSDAAGQTVDSDLGTLAIGTDGTIIKEHTDDIFGCVVSEADGDIDFNFTSASAQTTYLQLVLPNGNLVTSTVTHA